MYNQARPQLLLTFALSLSLSHSLALQPCMPTSPSPPPFCPQNSILQLKFR